MLNNKSEGKNIQFSNSLAPYLLPNGFSVTINATLFMGVREQFGEVKRWLNTTTILDVVHCFMLFQPRLSVLRVLFHCFANFFAKIHFYCATNYNIRHVLLKRFFLLFISMNYVCCNSSKYSIQQEFLFRSMQLISLEWFR